MSDNKVMIRWCGPRANGKEVTTVEAPFAGHTYMQGKNKNAYLVLVVTQREMAKMTKTRNFLKLKLGFEVHTTEVLIDGRWTPVGATYDAGDEPEPELEILQGKMAGGAR